MRKVGLLLAIMAAALMLATGVAVAKSINGGPGPDRLVGTNQGDNISGGGSNDSIFGRGGFDRLNGDTGSDFLRGGMGGDTIYGNDGDDDMFGNDGNDYINALDGRTGETIDCGAGNNDSAVIDIDDSGFDGDEDGGIMLFDTCENVFVPVNITGVASDDGLRQLTDEEIAQILGN